MLLLLLLVLLLLAGAGALTIHNAFWIVVAVLLGAMVWAHYNGPSPRV